MAPTDSQIAKLRRMVAEPTEAIYTNAVLSEYIANYPTVDENGEDPRIPSTTTPGEMMVNPDWTETYDLHMAAAAIWEEKAAARNDKFDFSADGASYDRSQMQQNAMRQARHHSSRRNPRTIVLVSSEARQETNETN